ncbi:MAG: hypothetical protein SGJ23_15855 [Alphaproteobacteria bacterium]|nr:hypothetical protein [Alphaproteobacteria bacterium]
MNAFEAFNSFAAAHRGEGGPSPEATAFIAAALHRYVASSGTETLDDVFGLDRGKGQRDPWTRINTSRMKFFYATQMAGLHALGFTVEEAAAAIAAQYAALGKDALAAATAQKAFEQFGGVAWAEEQDAHREALADDAETTRCRLRLIPADALPVRFRDGVK